MKSKRRITICIAVLHCFRLKCFRAGTHRNNSLFALAGRQNVAPITFIGNHMIYRDIVVNNTQVRVEAPDDINKFIVRNESFLG